MPYFSTVYHVNGRAFASVIQASDRAHALLLAVQRGFGETVHGALDAPPGDCRLQDILSRDPLEPGDMAAAFHAACWLGFLALSSGVAVPREILGDEGLAHALAHLAAGDSVDPEGRIADILRQAHDLETRIPGFPAPAGSARATRLEGEPAPRPVDIPLPDNRSHPEHLDKLAGDGLRPLYWPLPRWKKAQGRDQPLSKYVFAALFGALRGRQ